MALLITCTLLEQLWFLKCKKFLKQINCVHIDIFHQKGYRFKIRMEFLQPILVKIELIYQQPAMTRPTGVIWVVSPAMGCWIGWLGADAVIWICKRWKTHWPIKKKWLQEFKICQCEFWSITHTFNMSCDSHYRTCLGYSPNEYSRQVLKKKKKFHVIAQTSFGHTDGRTNWCRQQQYFFSLRAEG